MLIAPGPDRNPERGSISSGAGTTALSLSVGRRSRKQQEEVLFMSRTLGMRGLPYHQAKVR